MIDQIFDMSLMKEMQVYAESALSTSFINPKAERVYNLCMDNDRVELAIKILRKYAQVKRNNPIRSDMAVAMGMHLAALKNNLA